MRTYIHTHVICVHFHMYFCTVYCVFLSHHRRSIAVTITFVTLTFFLDETQRLCSFVEQMLSLDLVPMWRCVGVCVWVCVGVGVYVCVCVCVCVCVGVGVGVCVCVCVHVHAYSTNVCISTYYVRMCCVYYVCCVYCVYSNTNSLY